MKIYTKTGDQGQTSLANMQRVSKTDDRLEAYGTADELNSWVGMLRASVNVEVLSDELMNQLVWIQNKLFNLGASLSAAPGEWIVENDVLNLEQWMDAMQETITPVHAFVLPSGSEQVARCHVCRTITRRLERRMVGLEDVNHIELQWVNRLSDYFFVLARYIGEKQHEEVEKWQK